MKKYVIIAISLFCFSGFMSKNADAAKRLPQADRDTTIYKIRRGSKPSKDVMLKVFTLKNGTWLTSVKYNGREGGWEVSTKNFHSGKYVYYFSLYDNWAWTNPKDISWSSRMPKLSWKYKKGSLLDSPAEHNTGIPLKVLKKRTWISDKEVQMAYGSKAIYYHVISGKMKGWVWRGNLKLAPHKSYTVVATDEPRVRMYNVDGSGNWLYDTAQAIQFTGSNVLWIHDTLEGSKPSDNDYNWTTDPNVVKTLN